MCARRGSETAIAPRKRPEANDAQWGREAGQIALPFGRTSDDLADYFSLAAGRLVSIVLTDNISSMISCKNTVEGISVRLHRMFLSAENAVLDDIANFITRRSRQTPCLNEFIRLYGNSLRENDSFRGSNSLLAGPGKQPALRPCGAVHDLRVVFARMNELYFGGRLECGITWGLSRGVSRGGGTGRRSVRTRTLGSYSYRTGTIRINPVLDRERVPSYYVDFVVYHEMLHADMGYKEHGSRRILHCREFRGRERAFPDYDRAISWERKHLGG